MKLILEALHTNTLPFLNDGAPLDVPVIGIEVSLAVIVGVLLITTVASLVKVRYFTAPEPDQPSDQPSDEPSGQAGAHDPVTVARTPGD